MLQWAITFLIIAIFAAILGFGGISAISVSMARGAFLIFVVLVYFIINIPALDVSKKTSGKRSLL